MNMATKKVTLKNEVSNILNNMQEVERPAHLSECPKEYKYQEGSFKCYVDTSVMSLEEVKKMIADNAVKLNRNLRHFHASELNQRSNSFQKALAYIGENRHLIPFFRFVAEWVQAHPDKSVQDAIRAYRKQNTLPSEVIPKYMGWGKVSYYELEDKAPDIYTVLSQISYLPKAWML